MNKKEELLNEFSNEVGGDAFLTIEGFLNFLVQKIIELENKEEKDPAVLETKSEVVNVIARLMDYIAGGGVPDDAEDLYQEAYDLLKVLRGEITRDEMLRGLYDDFEHEQAVYRNDD